MNNEFVKQLEKLNNSSGNIVSAENIGPEWFPDKDTKYKGISNNACTYYFINIPNQDPDITEYVKRKIVMLKETEYNNVLLYEPVNNIVGLMYTN